MLIREMNTCFSINDPLYGGIIGIDSAVSGTQNLKYVPTFHQRIERFSFIFVPS